jgi:hypothetical protein
MNNVAKKVEVSANIAIILVATLLAAVLVERYLLAPKTPGKGASAEALLRPGSRLSLAGVDWGKSDRTLLMVLSTNCHYCNESAPFYQRLAQEKAKWGGKARLVAVMPQETSESQKYLGEHGIAVDEIKQASPGAVQAPGTPTLLLVDQTGIVTNAWVGKLTPDKESEVLDRLQSKS